MSRFNKEWFKQQLLVKHAPSRVMFYANHRDRFLCLVIAKNASSSLKGMILDSIGEDISHGFEAARPHHRLGYEPDNLHCIDAHSVNDPKYKDYTRFAVWRDPVDRFESLLAWINLKGRQHGRWGKIRQQLPELDVEDLLKLIEAEVEQGSVDEIDQHLRCQYHYLQCVPELDFLVPVEHLQQFFREKFALELPHWHATPSQSRQQLPESHRQTVQSLYNVDWLIPVWMQEKIYLPADSQGPSGMLEGTAVVLVVHSESQLGLQQRNLAVLSRAKSLVLLDASGGTIESSRLKQFCSFIDSHEIVVGGSHDALGQAISLAHEKSRHAFLLYGDEIIRPPVMSVSFAAGGHVEILFATGSSQVSRRFVSRDDTAVTLVSGVSGCYTEQPGLLNGLCLCKSPAHAPGRQIIENDIGQLEGLVSAKDSAINQYILGETYAALSRHRESRQAFRLSALLADNADLKFVAYYHQARQAEQMGEDTLDIVASLEAAWQASPGRAEALYRMGWIFRQHNELDPAERVLRQAMNLPLRHLHIFFDRSVYEYRARMEHGLVRHRQSRFQNALKDFRRVNQSLMSQRLKAWLSEQARQSAESLDVSSFTALPSATPAFGKRKLTIGMATYDDYDGVYFSVMAIRLFHPEITEDSEIVVIDNNPTGRCSRELKALANRVANYRYVPLGGVNSTAVRDALFKEANGEYVLCIDSHVFLEAGALARFVDFLDAHPDCEDLLQGPLIDDSLRGYSTHFAPKWGAGMYGVWDRDPRGKDPEAEPFEIPMQGLGLFGCRKQAWPGFNPRFKGFGGEEGYIHEKFRRAGRKTLCLPFLRWVHRFARPMGPPYEVKWPDRIRNYLLGFEEVQLDTTELREHFIAEVGESLVDSVVSKFEQEKRNPFYDFEAIYCINLDKDRSRWKQVQDQLEILGIKDRVYRFPAVETPGNHHIGCALSHRLIIEYAKRRRLSNILVLEDDVVFSIETLKVLATALQSLSAQDWKLCYLGGHKWGQSFAAVKGGDGLEHCRGVTMTHAIAYNQTVFDEILDAVPNNYRAVVDWLKIHHGIDQYLRSIDRKFMVAPTVASQPHLHGSQDTWKTVCE